MDNRKGKPQIQDFQKKQTEKAGASELCTAGTMVITIRKQYVQVSRFEEIYRLNSKYLYLRDALKADIR